MDIEEALKAKLEEARRELANADSLREQVQACLAFWATDEFLARQP